MAILYPLLYSSLLAIIIYQDFRYRALSIYVLAGAIMVNIINSWVVNGWKQALMYVGINIVLVAIQLIGVAAYFSFKHKTYTSIINTYLGSGDLLFYIAIALTFSPLNFVLFNLLACLVILLVYAITAHKSNHGKTIPFAGCMALGLIFVIASSYVFRIIKPYDDYFMSFMIFGGLRDLEGLLMGS